MVSMEKMEVKLTRVEFIAAAMTEGVTGDSPLSHVKDQMGDYLKKYRDLFFQFKIKV